MAYESSFRFNPELAGEIREWSIAKKNSKREEENSVQQEIANALLPIGLGWFHSAGQKTKKLVLPRVKRIAERYGITGPLSKETAEELKGHLKLAYGKKFGAEAMKEALKDKAYEKYNELVDRHLPAVRPPKIDTTLSQDEQDGRARFIRGRLKGAQKLADTSLAGASPADAIEAVDEAADTANDREFTRSLIMGRNSDLQGRPSTAGTPGMPSLVRRNFFDSNDFTPGGPTSSTPNRGETPAFRPDELDSRGEPFRKRRAPPPSSLRYGQTVPLQNLDEEDDDMNEEPVTPPRSPLRSVTVENSDEEMEEGEPATAPTTPDLSDQRSQRPEVSGSSTPVSVFSSRDSPDANESSFRARTAFPSNATMGLSDGEGDPVAAGESSRDLSGSFADLGGNRSGRMFLSTHPSTASTMIMGRHNAPVSEDEHALAHRLASRYIERFGTNSTGRDEYQKSLSDLGFQRRVATHAGDMIEQHGLNASSTSAANQTLMPPQEVEENPGEWSGPDINADIEDPEGSLYLPRRRNITMPKEDSMKSLNKIHAVAAKAYAHEQGLAAIPSANDDTTLSSDFHPTLDRIAEATHPNVQQAYSDGISHIINGEQTYRHNNVLDKGERSYQRAAEDGFEVAKQKLFPRFSRRVQELSGNTPSEREFIPGHTEPTISEAQPYLNKFSDRFETAFRGSRTPFNTLPEGTTGPEARELAKTELANRYQSAKSSAAQEMTKHIPIANQEEPQPTNTVAETEFRGEELPSSRPGFFSRAFNTVGATVRGATRSAATFGRGIKSKVSSKVAAVGADAQALGAAAGSEALEDGGGAAEDIADLASTSRSARQGRAVGAIDLAQRGARLVGQDELGETAGIAGDLYGLSGHASSGQRTQAGFDLANRTGQRVATHLSDSADAEPVEENRGPTNTADATDQDTNEQEGLRQSGDALENEGEDVAERAGGRAGTNVLEEGGEDAAKAVAKNAAISGGEAAGEDIAGEAAGIGLADTVPIIGQFIGGALAIGLALRSLKGKHRGPAPVVPSFQGGL